MFNVLWTNTFIKYDETKLLEKWFICLDVMAMSRCQTARSYTLFLFRCGLVKSIGRSHENSSPCVLAGLPQLTETICKAQFDQTWDFWLTFLSMSILKCYDNFFGPQSVTVKNSNGNLISFYWSFCWDVQNMFSLGNGLGHYGLIFQSS
jgi:hypothetical protein